MHLQAEVTTQVRIKNEKGEYLLLRLAEPGRKFHYPGGHVDENENYQQAAEREVREETGLTIKCGEAFRVFQITWKDKPLIGLVCNATTIVNSSLSIKLSSEHDAYRWFSVQEIKTSADVDEHLLVDFSWSFTRKSRLS